MDLPQNINPQDLTFEKVWLLFKETDKKIEQVAQTVAATNAKVDRLAEIYGGFMNNVARTAEGYFYNALLNLLKEKDEIEINGFKFYRVLKNVIIGSKKKRKEFDILLENPKDKLVALIEIKMNVRSEDVERFVASIQEFVKNDKIYFDYKIILGIGGYDFEPDALEKAKQYGMFILKRSFENDRIIFENTGAQNLKVYY